MPITIDCGSRPLSLGVWTGNRVEEIDLPYTTAMVIVAHLLRGLIGYRHDRSR